ncbi:hypothetical protein CCACVL1_27870 [Corchorus capsularis]|uniref:Uncharacterized protein n=1 Tax=Corchorus capsularis TaxID=210143 RepID=A0A1R3G8B3_COCAP|nr:hypothetical protein CCACVL1_27870 [Corchorus capsularis]
MSMNAPSIDRYSGISQSLTDTM